jgi:hypothetical protein
MTPLGSIWEASVVPTASADAEHDRGYARVLDEIQGLGVGMGNDFHKYR